MKKPGSIARRKSFFKAFLRSSGGSIACALLMAGLLGADPAPSPAAGSPPPTQPTEPAPTKPSPATSTPSGTMSKIVVKAVPLEEQVLPTARPISSVYGTDMSILDTPRSVSIITKQQLEDRQITTVQDLGQFSSGTYSPAEYGLDGIPNIRGIYAGLYQNGQQEIFYRNSILPSFNQVESLDLVKGPGSAVYGPTVGGAGGYVNFITKEPEFQDATVLSTTIGAYAPGGQSWGHAEWSADTTGPLIKNQLAYRLSYEGDYGDEYYQNDRFDKEDIFSALSWIPTSDITMDWTFQYYNTLDNEVNGFTRPTQDLINNDSYIVGPQPGAYSPITQTQTQRVYGYESLTGPYDSARGEKIATQLITKYNVDSDLAIWNYQYFERIDSRKLDTFGYDELVPGVDLYDTRTEIHYDYDFKIAGLDIQNHDISGAGFRGQEGTTFSDYSTEPYNAYDITQTGTTFNQHTIDGGGYISPIYPQGYGGYEINLKPGYSAGVNLYDPVANAYTSGVATQYGVYDAGLFFQHITDFGKVFTTLFGARLDYMDGWSHIPTQDLVNYPVAVLGNDQTNAQVFNYSVFGSGIYHITKDQSFYVTYNQTTGFNGDSNFGGLEQATSSAVTSQALRQESDLYEGGYKGSFFNNTLYGSVDGYYQTYFQATIGGPPVLTESRGVETDVAYQPNRNFSITSNFTWMEVTLHDDNPYEQTGYPLGIPGGTPSFTSYGTGNYNDPGEPKLYFNAFAIYKFDNGFGAGVGPQVIGRQNADLTGQLIIPAQMTWNAELFYKRKAWEAQLNINNFTDQRNWTVIDPGFTGNDALLQSLPLNITATFKFRF